MSNRELTDFWISTAIWKFSSEPLNAAWWEMSYSDGYNVCFLIKSFRSPEGTRQMFLGLVKQLNEQLDAHQHE